MPKLKRFFITPFIFVLFATSVHILLQLVDHWNNPVGLAWLGAAISVWPWFGFFVYLISAGRARIPYALDLHHALALTGTLIAVYASYRGAGNAPTAIVEAVVGLVGGLLYALWYSRFPRRNRGRLQPGKPLPEFTLADLAGSDVSSREFRGQTTLILFYRGNWCPLCVAQVKELAEGYRDLAQRGVAVVLVSPQPQKHTQALAARFDAPMQFMLDPGNRAARALGIDAPGGIPLGMGLQGYAVDTVLPTLLIIDGTGTILFADLTDNYRIRPDPENFLAILDHGQAEAS